MSNKGKKPEAGAPVKPPAAKPATKPLLGPNVDPQICLNKLQAALAPKVGNDANQLGWTVLGGDPLDLNAANRLSSALDQLKPSGDLTKACIDAGKDAVNNADKTLPLRVLRTHS